MRHLKNMPTHLQLLIIIQMAAFSSKQFKNICVLIGFYYGKYKKFVQVVVDLGCVIAETKLHLVYRGCERWLSRLAS